MPDSVNVAIATYRRPDRLRDALASIAESARQAGPDWSVGVTLVDDDPDGSARAVAEEFSSTFDLGCTYLECGSQNISVARNAGLESALPTAAWVGSIDDDVTVPPEWVQTCGRAVQDGRHHAVTGPLLKDFRNGPAWLSREPFDQLGILAGTDGEDAFVCATGNSWMRSTFLLERPDLRFDPALGRTGGEDMDFFYRAVDAGLRPVFSTAAGVSEVEPPARCTLRYQVRRAFWLGISEAQISRTRRLASRPRLLARAVRRAANRGRAQLSPDDWSRRGRRYDLTVVAQCLGLTLGVVGVRMRHK